MIYSVVAEGLVNPVGSFLSAVCPSPAEPTPNKKKTKSVNKAAKRKRKSPGRGSNARSGEPGESVTGTGAGPNPSPEIAHDRPEARVEAVGVGAIWPAREPQRQGARGGHTTPRT